MHLTMSQLLDETLGVAAPPVLHREDPLRAF